MEQEYGEPTTATSLAARTVLPGEPFDAPAASAVPGPRDELAEAESEPFADETPQWNFAPTTGSDFAAPPLRSFEPASYDPTYGEVVDPHHAPADIFTPTYASAESLTAPDQFESLHEYGALPVAEDYDQAGPASETSAPPAYDLSPAPAYPAPVDDDASAPGVDYSGAMLAYPAPEALAFPAPAYPSPAGDLPAYPVAEAPAWPAPVEEVTAAPETVAEDVVDENLLAPEAPSDEVPVDEDGTQRKTHRGPSKGLLALAAIVILGGGGYFGYTQLSKSDSNTNTNNAGTVPVTSVAPKAPVNSTPVATPTTSAAYSFPANLAGFSMRSSSSAAALQRQITSFSKGAYAAYMGTPMVASYGSASTASLVAITFHPVASKLSAGYAAMLTGVQKPATGNTVGTFKAVPAGAAGGSMTCGAQTGASPISYCVWKSSTAIGMVYMKGQTSSPINQALTRELRAYAEH